MAGFGRSNSLSINTGGTGASLFGNANASQGQQSAGPFGASTNASQPPQSGGTFGQSTSQPPSGGLFGQSTAQPQQSGGLFGNLQKPAQQQTGGLFGASTAQSQPQQTGSLLGGTLGQQNQAQTQPQSAGLFGNLGQQKPATPSLFGASQAKPSPSLFGSSFQQPQQQQPQSSLFGMAPPTTQSTTGSTLLGQQPTASFSQHTGGGLGHEDAHRIRGTTQFTDLKAALQTEITTIDTAIQEHMAWARKNTEALAAHGARIAQVPRDAAFVAERFVTAELALDNDVLALDRVKALHRADEADAHGVHRAFANMALPQQFHYASMRGLNSSNAASSAAAVGGDEDEHFGQPVDLVAFFAKRGAGLDETLAVYNRQIHEIELHLRTVEAGAVQRERELIAQTQGGSARGNEKQELYEALKAIEGAILQVAGQVGTAREMAVKETLGAVGR